MEWDTIRSNSDVLQEIRLALGVRTGLEGCVTIRWCPSHVGLIWNEAADRLASLNTAV